MKKILLFLVILISLSVQAQTDTSGIKVIEPPDSTGFGIPDGKLVSKEIGPDGGTIISDDGRVELNFPAGALDKTLTISIQPVTNLAPNGTGNSYQFEPSGIQFKQPVEIIFHYSDEEAYICHPELMALAMQDHTGKWTFLDYDDWDSTGKMLRGSIHHFSFVSNINQLQLKPSTDRLRVNDPSIMDPRTRGAGPMQYAIIEIIDISKRARRDWGVTEGNVPGHLRRDDPILWYANGIKNGSPAVGFLPPAIERSNMDIITITQEYGSPIFLPARNPVVISAEVYTYSSKTRRFGLARTLRCKIQIYDEYKITIIKKGPSILECGAELEDSSSFKVKLYGNKKPEISDVINAPPTLTKQANCSGESRGGRGGGGYPLKYDPGGSLGPVHVSSGRLAGYGMMYNQGELTAPEITIEFAPAPVIIMNSKGKYPEEIKEYHKAVPGVTVGNKIKFKANREHQDFTLGGNGTNGYQLIIDPL